MAIDFPASPTLNQTFSSGNVNYVWDGTKWTASVTGGIALDQIIEGNTKAEVIDTGSDGRFVVTTEGSERLRVTSVGLVGIGTASPTVRLETVGSASILGATNVCARFSDNTNSTFAIGHPTGGGVDLIGNAGLNFCTSNGTTKSERARIDSSGRLLVGTSTALGPSTTSTGITLYPNDYSVMSSAGNEPLTLNRNNDGAILSCRRSGTSVGSISVTTTATAFNTSSDYRLKENVVDLDGATARLKELPVHRFNFIAEPAKTVDGFLAHEVQTIVPEAITGEKDAEDDDGNPIYQGIDQSKLVPLLTAALQEAVAKIETLQGMVAVNNMTIDEQHYQISALADRLTALESA